MAFRFTPLALPEVIAIDPEIFPDNRGFFLETYKYSEFSHNGIHAQFVQGNHSHSAQKTLRGLHYQKPPHAQGKLIRVVQGEIFDVVVDLRKGSPRFGKWIARILSAENHQMIYIPPGFAHGAFIVSKEATLLYMVTSEYEPASERGIIWNDPLLGISWPSDDPILSGRDKTWPTLVNADNDFVYERCEARRGKERSL
jgi:dTDP-4-dehydrorhamnose 3,5-epimerase